jgi:RNA polymerase sigma factor (TIGR02999 family)
VTLLLEELAHGKQEAADQLMPLVYDELRRLAGRYMRREREDHTLQTTALVHEAYMKLVEQRSVNWQSRAHFFGIAAHLMRRVLLDHARGHLREKRGAPGQATALVELDGALEKLAALDARQARIVELRFFAGLTVEEAAEVLGVSPKTVKRDWSVAKAWLHGELKPAYDAVAGEMGNR